MCSIVSIHSTIMIVSSWFNSQLMCSLLKFRLQLSRPNLYERRTTSIVESVPYTLKCSQIFMLLALLTSTTIFCKLTDYLFIPRCHGSNYSYKSPKRLIHLSYPVIFLYFLIQITTHSCYNIDECSTCVSFTRCQDSWLKYHSHKSSLL